VDEQQKEDIDVVRQSQSDVLEKAQSALAEARDPASAQALTDAAKHMQTTLEHLGEAVELASAAELAHGETARSRAARARAEAAGPAAPRPAPGSNCSNWSLETGKTDTRLSDLPGPRSRRSNERTFRFSAAFASWRDDRTK
jgi:hypothetical protein